MAQPLLLTDTGGAGGSSAEVSHGLCVTCLSDLCLKAEIRLLSVMHLKKMIAQRSEVMDSFILYNTTVFSFQLQNTEFNSGWGGWGVGGRTVYFKM